MVGLDLVYNIHDYILKHLSGQKEPSPLLKKLRGEGKLGFKTGEGFQAWTDAEKAASNAALNEYLVNMLLHNFAKPTK
jgi:3-hydroxybutyryl-CoA dehydrogenase